MESTLKRVPEGFRTPPAVANPHEPAKKKRRVAKVGELIKRLGPGLVTGASDDDPSGIATYSQVGAQFGYGMCWTMIFCYPLMSAIQEISARIGRVTGHGIAENIRRHYPPWLLHTIVALLLIANIINLGADLGAMGAALKLLIGGPQLAYVIAFGVLCAALQIFVSYARYAAVLKWLCLALLAYVATVFVVGVPWATVAKEIVLPSISLDNDYVTGVVAVLGTTISPYLFFWQASQEVERERDTAALHPLKQAPSQAPVELERIRWDTYIGMAVSNLIGLFIIITTAATLHAHGVTNIQTSSQAAEALRPIAGSFAFAVFAAGIVGTGLLGVPVLAGSAAYGLADAFRWPIGLNRLPHEAKSFYTTIAIATLVAIALNFMPIDPIKALFWSAVINGITASPVMAVIMLMTVRRRIMGRFTLPLILRFWGWATTAVMAICILGMVWRWVT
jgi:NRAMP (natural resistance-associated macrophage protein)-like metal ion transporter